MIIDSTCTVVHMLSTHSLQYDAALSLNQLHYAFNHGADIHRKW